MLSFISVYMASCALRLRFSVFVWTLALALAFLSVFWTLVLVLASRLSSVFVWHVECVCLDVIHRVATRYVRPGIRGVGQGSEGWGRGLIFRDHRDRAVPL